MTINVYTHVMDEYKRKEAAKFSLFPTFRTAEKYTYKKSCVGENGQKTEKNKYPPALPVDIYFSIKDSKCERQDKTLVLFDKIERFFCHVANGYAIVAHKRTFKRIVYSVFPIFGDSVIADCGAYYGTYGRAVTIGIEACADS